MGIFTFLSRFSDFYAFLIRLLFVSFLLLMLFSRHFLLFAIFDTRFLGDQKFLQFLSSPKFFVCFCGDTFLKMIFTDRHFSPFSIVTFWSVFAFFWCFCCIFMMIFDAFLTGWSYLFPVFIPFWFFLAGVFGQVFQFLSIGFLKVLFDVAIFPAFCRFLGFLCFLAIAFCQFFEPFLYHFSSGPFLTMIFGHPFWQWKGGHLWSSGSVIIFHSFFTFCHVLVFVQKNFWKGLFAIFPFLTGRFSILFVRGDVFRTFSHLFKAFCWLFAQLFQHFSAFLGGFWKTFLLHFCDHFYQFLKIFEERFLIRFLAGSVFRFFLQSFCGFLRTAFLERFLTTFRHQPGFLKMGVFVRFLGEVFGKSVFVPISFFFNFLISFFMPQIFARFWSSFLSAEFLILSFLPYLFDRFLWWLFEPVAKVFTGF